MILLRLKIELSRFFSAMRSQWKRVLVGAALGWLIAVVGGAFGLVMLEYQHVVSQTTSDDLVIALPLAGVGLGAMLGYATRSPGGPDGNS